MIYTYMSKDTAIFVATGIILNYAHADMSLRVASGVNIAVLGHQLPPPLLLPLCNMRGASFGKY